jgi:hypothetical protein
MPPLRGLIFLGFGSTKIPLLTEPTHETPNTIPWCAGQIRRPRHQRIIRCGDGQSVGIVENSPIQMTPAEFIELANQRTDAELLGLCLHDDSTPYVFESEPAKWKEFREFLAPKLDVAPADIRVVGSGRFGFSMNPAKNFKHFGDTSDIDVVIVNADIFDSLWLSLLRAAYPRPPVTNRLGTWLETRRNELYTGWLTPREIRIDVKIYGQVAKPVVDFNFNWFTTMKVASQILPTRHEDITSRLYRTWNHAELYHLHSLGALRKSLIN